MFKASFDTDKISVRIGIVFSRFGLTPNTWTIMALVPAFFGFLSLLSGDLFIALLLFAAAGAIDAIDGAVAKVTGSVTAFGGFLDGVIDRYVEIFMYIGLLFYTLPMGVEFYLPNPVWFSLLVFGALMPTYVTAYSHHRGVLTDPGEHRMMEGLIARNERLWIIYAGMLFGCMEKTFLVYFIAVLAVLTNVTAVQRIWFVVSHKKRGHA